LLGVSIPHPVSKYHALHRGDEARTALAVVSEVIAQKWTQFKLSEARGLRRFSIYSFAQAKGCFLDF
jgi:hypothetical protein